MILSHPNPHALEPFQFISILELTLIMVVLYCVNLDKRELFPKSPSLYTIRFDLAKRNTCSKFGIENSSSSH